MQGKGWGACVMGGMNDRGVCMAGGVHWVGGACVAGEMATAAEGTHPTGMLQTHLHQNSTISYK